MRARGGYICRRGRMNVRNQNVKTKGRIKIRYSVSSTVHRPDIRATRTQYTCCVSRLADTITNTVRNALNLAGCEALSSHPQGPRRLREVTGGGAGMVPYELPPHGVVIGASMEKPCSSGCTDASPAFH